MDWLNWIFYVAVGVQAIFYALAALAISRYTPLLGRPNPNQGVSVIVCARNEHQNLQKLIPALLQQDHLKFQVIVVDDQSTDNTQTLGDALAKAEPKLIYRRIEKTPRNVNSKKHALTMGIKAASFDCMLLTDADCWPISDRWISEMAVGFDSPDRQFVIGYSQYAKSPGPLNGFIRYETMATAINYVGLGLMGRPYMAVGRNFGYRKSLFLKYRGFTGFQSIVGGDDDLLVNRYARHSNTRFVLSTHATVYSVAKKDISSFARQKIRHLAVGKHYRLPDRLILGALTASKLALWISLGSAILSGKATFLMGGCFFLAMVSLLTAVWSLKRKTGDKSGMVIVPLLEFLYIFYYLSIGLIALFTKKIRWK
jgi:glycosyltransferase involved in cell wall biosynthesis